MAVSWHFLTPLHCKVCIRETSKMMLVGNIILTFSAGFLHCTTLKHVYVGIHFSWQDSKAGTISIVNLFLLLAWSSMKSHQSMNSPHWNSRLNYSVKFSSINNEIAWHVIKEPSDWRAKSDQLRTNSQLRVWCHPTRSPQSTQAGEKEKKKVVTHPVQCRRNACDDRHLVTSL